MYERILVATDGSDAATRAADEAIAIATRMHAALDVLFVVDETSLPLDAHSQRLTRRLENDGRESVDGTADRARAAGVESVTGAVRRGAPAETILAYAAERDADLIVLGTHGRRALERVLLGSTAQRVVCRSPVPTLAVGDSRAAAGRAP